MKRAAAGLVVAVVGLVAVGSLLTACGGGGDDSSGSAADEHARTACRRLFDAAAAFDGIDPTDESDENAADLDARNERFSAAMADAAAEARAAATSDRTYDEFATGMEAREAITHGSESGRELEAQTATQTVIAPTCARLGVRP